MQYIELTKGYKCIVDDEDYALVSQHKWFVNTSSKMPYAQTNIWLNGKRTCIQMQRFLLGLKDKLLLADHINRNSLDNRRTNLRIVTKVQNQQNSKRKSSLPYKGVYFHPDSKINPWMAQIGIGKRKHLGMFTTMELAAKAYNEAAIKYFGEYACLNKLSVS